MESIQSTPGASSLLILAAAAGLLFLLIVVVALAVLLRPKPREEFPYVTQPVMTDAELAFHLALADCVPTDTILLSKVRLADFLEVKAQPGEHLRYFGRISQKHADFLLIDAASSDPLLVIELDDASHRRSQRTIDSDAFKDKAYAAAGIPILRVPAARRYDRADLEEKIAEALEA
ncbi:DUF2726 domain-containing protein [bacterium]|nr:DUF2726 domain-containing protein [bacterium]